MDEVKIQDLFVYRFAKRIAKMSYDYNLRHILTDNDDAFDWFTGKHSYSKLLFSFKPLRLECWFTKDELQKLIHRVINKEELNKVPFRMVSHMAMEGEHYSLYANDDYGFKMQKTVKIKKDGFTSGKTYTDYYFNGKWYNSLDKFLEAIKLVRPINPVEVTESGCKIIDIRLKTDKKH